MATAYDLDLTDFEKETDLDGYQYPLAGVYHLLVLDVDDDPEGIDAVKVTCEVLAGTVAGQEKRQFTETLFAPKADSKDGGKFAKKKLAKFALAVGLINPAALGQRVQIDWNDARGRQFVGKLEEYERKGKDGKAHKGAQVDGLNMHAVTAPEVAAIPKDAEALRIMGIELPPADGGANGNGDGQPGGEATGSDLDI